MNSREILKTLPAIMAAVSEYTPDDVAEACNEYLDLFRGGANGFAVSCEGARINVLNVCDGALDFWTRCPNVNPDINTEANRMAVRALRAFVDSYRHN